MAHEPDDFEDLVDEGSRRRTRESDRQFAAALRLRDWARDLFEGPARQWKMEPGHLDNVFIGTLARATKTFRALTLLCDRGFGQQAGMLDRSLYEDAVVSWWLLLCVEDEAAAMRDLGEHYRHAKVLYDRGLQDFPELDSGQADESISDDCVAELDKKFGRYGSQWHRKRLDELVRAVEAEIDERYKTLFPKFFRFVNHTNNYFLHHSSWGIADVVEWEDPADKPRVETGPSLQWQDSSLWVGVWCYGLVALATLRRLAPDQADEFSDLLDELGVEFLTDEQRENL